MIHFLQLGKEGCKSVYYIRTIQKNTNIAKDKEECESCSGQKKNFFNPSGIDHLMRERLSKEIVTNIFNLNNVKYGWANHL